MVNILNPDGTLNANAGDYAGLDKDLTVVGVAERIEIWDTGTWTQVTADADTKYADIDEALSEHGI